jgi:hypothetical protein
MIVAETGGNDDAGDGIAFGNFRMSRNFEQVQQIVHFQHAAEIALPPGSGDRLDVAAGKKTRDQCVELHRLQSQIIRQYTLAGAPGGDDLRQPFGIGAIARQRPNALVDALPVAAGLKPGVHDSIFDQDVFVADDHLACQAPRRRQVVDDHLFHLFFGQFTELPQHGLFLFG